MPLIWIGAGFLASIGRQELAVCPDKSKRISISSFLIKIAASSSDRLLILRQPSTKGFSCDVTPSSLPFA